MRNTAFNIGFIFLFFLFHSIVPCSAFAKFPCDLDTQTDLPEIYLSGETHSNFYCVIDKEMHESFAQDEKTFLLAKEGKLYSELDSFDNSMGLEDLTVHDLAIALSAHPSTEQNSLKSSLDGLSWLFAHSEALSHYQKLKELLNPQFPELYKKIELYLSSNDRKNNKQLMSLVETSGLSQKQLKGAIDLITMLLHTSYIKEYNTTHIKELTKKYPSITFEKISQFKGWDIDYQDKFVLDLRNKIFSAQLAKAYCSYSVKHNRPIVAIVGSAHLDGLKSILDKISDGKVPVKIRQAGEVCSKLFSSSTPSETQKIIAENYGHFCWSNEIKNHEVEKIAELAEFYHTVYNRIENQERYNDSNTYKLSGIPNIKEMHIPRMPEPEKRAPSIMSIFEAILLPAK